jgi:hypothetical protein
MANRANLGVSIPVSPAKIAIAFIGTAVFLVAGCVVSYLAWHAQSLGQMMPNGNGGLISPRDGYKFSAVMFLLSLVYAWRASTLLKRRSK